MLKLSDVNKTFYAKTGLVKIFVSRNIVYVIIRAEEGILGLCERSIARAMATLSASEVRLACCCATVLFAQRD